MDNLLQQVEQLLEQGNHWLQQKKSLPALLSFNKAVLLMPEHHEALINCATLLIDLNRAAESTVYIQRALQINPTENTWIFYGKALYLIGEYSQALECFDQVLIQRPKQHSVLGQRALCLTQLNRHDEALQNYQQALDLCAYKDHWLIYNYSLCLLATGNLVPGFNFFESRWYGPLRAKNQAWSAPEILNRDILLGKSILVHSEQGLGDSIQFFRYLPLLVDLGLQVVVEVQSALIPVFKAWQTTIGFIAVGSSLPFCDYHCSLMSLARLFKTELLTIPQALPYLSPDRASFEACKEKLGASDFTRVGIAWKGSEHHVMNNQRSIELTKLLSVQQAKIEFICLQKELTLEEQRELKSSGIAYHGLELSTMMGTAALIANLDLVITVDTSIAHLAAAMGKNVWILLPLCSDWRWFLHRDDSPWYPSVKLFRQTILGDWSIPLARIKQELGLFQPLVLKHSMEELIHQSSILVQKGQWTQAEQLYQLILVNNPIAHSALHEIALIAFQQNNLAKAIQFIQQAVDLAPEVVLYRRNLGELLRRVGQFKAAIAVLIEATNIEPHSAETYFLLGLAYSSNQQFEQAIQQYQIALSYDEHYGLAWNNLGTSLERIGDKEQAKQAYSKALSLNYKHIEAHNNLGALYSEEGRLNEARAHFEAAITADPNFIEAHYNLSLIKTYTADDAHLNAIELMLPKVNHFSVPTRIRYYFTLGKALDDIKQYHRAFQAYAEGNRLHYLHNPWDKTKLHEFVEHLPELFTRVLQEPVLETTETRRPIFIVGMPRSGTTLIEQILASHDAVYGAGELNILDEVIQKACQLANQPFHVWCKQLSDAECIDLGKEYLDKVWQLAPDKNYIIDKMPSNCFYVGMIYRMLPQAKIIHALRDPMDSCFSCFTHLFKEGMTFSYDLKALGLYYAYYAKAMQHWNSILPDKLMFNLHYEQLIEQTELFSKRLLDYIGLPWDPNCLNFYNNKRLVKTASLTQVRKPIYKTSIQRWQYFAKDLHALLDSVAPYRIKQESEACYE